MINDRLREIRLCLNLSQDEFGSRIGIDSRGHISALENGKRNITDRIIGDLCREYNLDEEWLRTGNGKMFRPVLELDERMRYVRDLMSYDLSSFHDLVHTFLLTYSQLDSAGKNEVNRFVDDFKENLIKKEEEKRK